MLCPVKYIKKKGVFGEIMTRIHVCDDSQLWLPVPQTKQQAASLKLSTLPLF